MASDKWQVASDKLQVASYKWQVKEKIQLGLNFEKYIFRNSLSNFIRNLSLDNYKLKTFVILYFIQKVRKRKE